MRIAVTGGGVAAAIAAEELRACGHEGEIDIFGAEPHLPDNRPPLSKVLLLGTEEDGALADRSSIGRPSSSAPIGSTCCRAEPPAPGPGRRAQR